MKKFFVCCCSLVLLMVTSCSIDERLESLEERVSQLEKLVEQMNANVISLQTVVNALQEKDFITSVADIKEGDSIVGYVIQFSKGESIKIYHGKDGLSPFVGVEKDVDGAYYWTVNAEWLFDAEGKKIPAGITPKLKIEDNYWYVSYDEGVCWIKLGQAVGEKGDKGEKGDSFFLSVTKDADFVYFHLQDGTTLTVPLVSDGAMLAFKFLSKNNPLHLSCDIECEIGEDGVIKGRIPNIVESKYLMPTFDYLGSRVFVDTVELVSGGTILDWSKPVKISVEGENGGLREYVVELMAFTGLPIVYINTEGGKDVTSKEEYLNATIRIVEDVYTRASGYVLESEVKIKGRGNTTWTLPKKPYKLKFESKQSLLGEPKDKEWILLANYTDKSLVRNALGLYMSKISNLEYTCRAHFVDLVLNNRYVGTYQLGEQQKISKNRVNVGDDGYLLEIDAKAASDDVTFNIPHIGKPINIKDPNVEAGGEAYDYVVRYMNRVDSVLFSENFTDSIEGYVKYMDVSSFVDWYVINEIAKNNDACFWTSCYMNLARDEKLKMGPVWDFDIAFGNVNYNNNYDPAGFWILKEVTWYKRLFKDEKFVVQVKDRFNYFYSNRDMLFNEINENASYLKYSVIENNSVWGTLYEYTWPNYSIWGSYDNEISYLKQWLNARMEWLKVEFDSL